MQPDVCRDFYMLAPLSPAIHLGANRLLIITTRDDKPDPSPGVAEPYPTSGEIGGYLLDTIFMDTLNSDLNRLRRINRTLAMMLANERSEYFEVEHAAVQCNDSTLIPRSRDAIRHGVFLGNSSL